MSETALLIQIFFLLLLILGYLGYLYSLRRKILKQKREEKNVSVSHFSGNLSAVLEKKSQEKLKERAINADKIIKQGDEQMTFAIPLAPDIQLLETDSCLLIKGSVQSIATICYEFSNMEQLPEGYCVQLGNWKLFILEDVPQSSREDRIVVMPRNHWLFMSSKLRDSIYGEDIHPYVYIYEPFTFKKVLEYGIGVEVIDCK
jgi:hypothetical protein